jgi:uncharacterized protein (TIGR00251 family)
MPRVRAPDSTPPSPHRATSGSAAPPSIEGHPDSVGPEFGRLQIGDHRGAIRVDVVVKPRSSRSSVLGVREGALEVALRAAPAEGAANDELRALLARALEVRKSDVEIVLGASSRGKVVQVHGVTVDEARARLARAKR